MIIKYSVVLYCLFSHQKHTDTYKYVPYTTSKLVTNNDLYNINKIMERIFIDKVKQEER